MGTDNPDLKALKCSKCGGDLVKSYRTEYDDEEEENVSIPTAKCSACGQEYNQKTEEYYGVFADDLSSDRDNSVFRLGIKGTLKDIEYEIIGRIRYQDEDEWEKSTWDEWFAVSADGTYHYFVEEDGEVHSYEDYTPGSIDLESDPGSIEFEGKKISRDEAYVGRIVFAEGELPWKPEIGEPATMYDFRKDGVKYTIEHSEDEVSITRGEKISYKDVVNAFGGEKEKGRYRETMTMRTTYRRRAFVYMAGCAVAFILAAVSCLNSSPVAGIMEKRTDLAANTVITENGQSMYQSEVLFGPFELKKGDALYNAQVSVNESVQKLSLEWQSFRLLLVPGDRLLKAANGRMTPAALRDVFDEVDALTEPVECYAMSGDFWDEEGHDDEGYWHESDLSVDDDFVLEKPGSYYAYLELTSQKPRSAQAVEVKLERSSSFRYYIIIIVILASLGFYNRAKARSYNAMPFAMSNEG
ncbi:MAG: DUF4178 domain-containing protein [Spirochaetes bacterium]|nr:DUF4178 domain-containing protein [Spirochaetota bacterium]HPG51838.1 DUF4178 domain-containing protein [Spirochaetota bacterium]